MDADWYEDPLGRYDGRFFDGEQWTARVSADGSPKIDPDFPPSATPPDGAAVAETAGEADAVAEQPAVAPVTTATKRATTLQESPVRVVAVLDPATHNRASHNRASRDQPDARQSGGGYLRWFLLAALALAAIVIIIVVATGDNSADSALDAQERVEDLESSGLSSESVAANADSLEVQDPAGEAPNAAFDPAESLQVGSLDVLNARSVLQELETWHLQYATERGIELQEGAGCWFGQLAGTAVQVVQCGPVGVGANGEPLFDLVPVGLEEVGAGHVAEPVTSDVTPDAVLANALVLVEHRDGTPAPPGFSTTRGERAGTEANYW